MKKLLISVVFIILVTACATPAQRFKQTAFKYGFKSQLLNSELFNHQIYLSDAKMDGELLHVYLDGDGTPWERQRWVADDPTARNPLILRLMKQDKQAAILLGRPCYYGLNKECENKYWTSHRYSREVVDSMAMALNTWISQHDFKRLVLIGYSGGGAIAMLMADQIDNISAIVTLAANLDVAKWSEFHGYSTLKSSLNPTAEIAPNSAIKQIHFAGKDDAVVPAFIIKEFAAKQKNARYYELPGKDHACRWEENWVQLLELID